MPLAAAPTSLKPQSGKRFHIGLEMIGPRQRLQMLGIYTKGLLAEMVKFVIRRDGAFDFFVYDAMRLLDFSAGMHGSVLVFPSPGSRLRSVPDVARSRKSPILNGDFSRADTGMTDKVTLRLAFDDAAGGMSLSSNPGGNSASAATETVGDIRGLLLPLTAVFLDGKAIPKPGPVARHPLARLANPAAIFAAGLLGYGGKASTPTPTPAVGNVGALLEPVFTVTRDFFLGRFHWSSIPRYCM